MGRGRTPLTDEEKAARDTMLREREKSALASLTDEDVFARFEHVVHNLPRKWSLTNALLLWAQAEEKGVALTDVRDFGGWLSVGRVPVGKGNGLMIYKPRFVQRTPADIAKRIAKGLSPDPHKYIGAYPAFYWTLGQTAMGKDAKAAEKWAAYQPPVITPGHAAELITEARARLTEQSLQGIVDTIAEDMRGEDDDEDDDPEPTPAPPAKPAPTPRKAAPPKFDRAPYPNVPVPNVLADCERRDLEIVAEWWAQLAGLDRFGWRVVDQAKVTNYMVAVRHNLSRAGQPVPEPTVREGVWLDQRTTRLTDAQRAMVHAWAKRTGNLGVKGGVTGSTMMAYNAAHGWNPDGTARSTRPTPEPEPMPEPTPIRPADDEPNERQRALAHLRGSGYTAKQYKGWDQAWRAWADDMRQQAIEQAEADTNGKLFNERGWAQYKAGKLSAMMLFKGPLHTVSGFMSPELKAWFAEWGRPSGEEYMAMLLTGKGSPTLAGQGRDVAAAMTA